MTTAAFPEIAAAAPAGTFESCSARIAICGALAVEIGGRRVDHLLPGHKGRQLFACLVVSREHPMSRDELIDVVWPMNTPVDPDGAFSTLLTRLRTALGPDVLRGRGELILDLGDEPWVDWELARDSVAAAEQRLAEGDAQAALRTAGAGLDVARRTLLAGISTPWIEDRRRELMEARVALLETVGRAALQLGGEHLPAAERSARDLIDCEPYRESAYALLMDIHSARGNIAEALRVYDNLRRLLRDELGLTPAPPVTALAAALLERKDRTPAQAAGAATVTGPSAGGDVDAAREHSPAYNGQSPLPPAIAAVSARPFAGGEPRLQPFLAAVLERATSRLAVVAVAGEPGIGKTRIAAEVAAHAHRAGHEVLYGRATGDNITPCQPFVAALRHHLGHRPETVADLLDVLAPELSELARLVPELRAVAPVPERVPGDERDVQHRRVQAVRGLCAAISRSRPLLLVLEDLHAADADTLTLLRHVVADDARGITILLTFRDHEPLPTGTRRVLLDLLRDRVLERIDVPPLHASEIAELVESRDGARGDARHGEAIRALTGGNPFYVEEIVGSQAGYDHLPAGLRDALETRLEHLPSFTRSVLEVAAAAGRSFDAKSVAVRAHQEREATHQALLSAVRTGLLISDRERSGRFAFRHGVVRQALLNR